MLQNFLLHFHCCLIADDSSDNSRGVEVIKAKKGGNKNNVTLKWKCKHYVDIKEKHRETLYKREIVFKYLHNIKINRGKSDNEWNGKLWIAKEHWRMIMFLSFFYIFSSLKCKYAERAGKSI